MFSFFQRSSINQYPLYSNIHTDFNTHLIPELENGGIQSLDESIQYLKALRALGLKKIITTPNVISGIYTNTSKKILNGYRLVENKLTTEKIDIQLEVAAKYFLDENFEELLEKDDILTFGEKYVLISLSFLERNKNLNQRLFTLISKGYTPILAHPEKYPYLLNKMDRLDRIKDMGCLFQVDLLSLTGFHGRAINRFALEIFAEKNADFVGSNIDSEKKLKEISNLPKSVIKLLEQTPLLNNTL